MHRWGLSGSSPVCASARGMMLRRLSIATYSGPGTAEQMAWLREPRNTAVSMKFRSRLADLPGVEFRFGLTVGVPPNALCCM
jgi:hypothetical protein